MHRSDPSLARSRRWIVATTALAAAVTAAFARHDGFILSPWSNATGFLLGGLAGSYIGERLERFAARNTVTSIVWLQMAALGIVLAGIVAWRALPAYCQMPVSFAVGVIVGTATIYLQRVRIR